MVHTEILAFFLKNFSREKSHFQQAKTTNNMRKKESLLLLFFNVPFKVSFSRRKATLIYTKNTYYSETKPAAYLMLAAELAEANLTASSRRGSAASIPGFSPS